RGLGVGAVDGQRAKRLSRARRRNWALVRRQDAVVFCRRNRERNIIQCNSAAARRRRGEDVLTIDGRAQNIGLHGLGVAKRIKLNGAVVADRTSRAPGVGHRRIAAHVGSYGGNHNRGSLGRQRQSRVGLGGASRKRAGWKRARRQRLGRPTRIGVVDVQRIGVAGNQRRRAA